ncbi:hypothetical protein EW145_g5032 [Phellinidium pouzarii]|uniref:Uncharacterized protein n=1 Tax=Phellinidium pouzarii TaxID=167371 RepID=A0A4S4L206_9AGAM|nr:hypothetical protein EW145_g5032 [Phellinidium pouzarii]
MNHNRSSFSACRTHDPYYVRTPATIRPSPQSGLDRIETPGASYAINVKPPYEPSRPKAGIGLGKLPPKNLCE